MATRALEVRYYGYNGFVIESDECKIAIDPGASLYAFDRGPVIPRSEWRNLTHVVVTHADPDHYWHADRVLAESRAPLVCGSDLIERRDGKAYMVCPRSGTVRYDVEVARAYPMDVGDRIHVDHVHFQALPAVHGDLELSFLFGLITRTVVKEPGKRFALGEMGFLMDVGGVHIANLGDTVFRPEWERMEPDILMVPIGGAGAKNTMDEEEALAAVEIVKPGLVIPCHYDCGFVLSRKANPADAASFKRGVERMGVQCETLGPGEALVYERSRSQVA